VLVWVQEDQIKESYMKRLFPLIVVLILLSTNVAFGATYYVSTTGRDTNGCTNATSDACATLTHALTKVASGAGDTILVRGGTYFNHTNKVYVQKNNVTIGAYPGEIPVFDMNWDGPCVVNDVTDQCWDALIYIRGCSNVKVDGLEMRNSNGTLFRVGQSGYTTTNITVSNCRMIGSYGTNTVTSHASNVVFDNCEIAQGNRGSSIWGIPDCRANGGWCDGANVGISEYSDNVALRRSTIRDSYNEGITVLRYDRTEDITVEFCQIYGNPKSQLYFDGTVNGIVRYNLIYGTSPNGNGQTDVGSGIIFSSECKGSCTDVQVGGYYQVYGNLLANNMYNLKVSTEDATYRKLKNIELYNNTFIFPRGKQNIAFLSDTAAGESDGHIFMNNIIYGSGTNGLSTAASGAQVAADYNLWSSAPNPNLNGAYDPTYADPMLIKTSGWNNLQGGELTGKEFALQAGSPAKYVGTTEKGGVVGKLVDCDQSNWKSGVFQLLNVSSPAPIGADIWLDDAVMLDAPTNLRILDVSP
jgi:hypothetical protein